MKSKIVQEFLKAAIKNAKAIKLRDDVDYFTSTMKQRTPGDPEQAGSVFLPEFLTRSSDGTVESLEHRLFQDHLADWVEYPDCPNLMPGAIALRFDWIRGENGHIHAALGRIGVVPLSTLKDDVQLTVDDRKNTGVASVIVAGEAGAYAQHAVAVITNEGTEEEPKWTLATVHPGDPIKPSSVTVVTDMELAHGTTITVAEAKKFGFTDAKIVTQKA